MSDTEVLYCRMDAELKNDLKAYAKQERRSMTFAAADLIRQALDLHKLRASRMARVYE